MRALPFLLITAGVCSAAPPQAPSPPQAPPVPLGWVGVTTPGLVWLTDYTAAVLEARRSGKRLVTLVTRSACAPCLQLKAGALLNSYVRTELANAVCVEVDGPSHPDFETTLGVEAYPTLYVTGPGTLDVVGFVRGNQSAATVLTALTSLTPIKRAAPAVAASPFTGRPTTQATSVRPAGPANMWYPAGTPTELTPTFAPGAGWRGVTSAGCPPRG